MPGQNFGTWAGTLFPVELKDRSLRYRMAFPPDKNIRVRADEVGEACPYNDWHAGYIAGGEETGMSPLQVVVTYDDDIRLGGTKAFSRVIQGQVLDVNGNALAGYRVELWWTNPDFPGANGPQLMGVTTSDANGNYGFAVDNTTKQYRVVTSNGARGGVSADTLTGQ